MVEPDGSDDRVRPRETLHSAAGQGQRSEERVTAGLPVSRPGPATAVVLRDVRARGPVLMHWAFVVACLYLLILLVVTCPVFLLAWYPRATLANAARVYLWAPYWAGVVVMFVCQAVLLLVPAREMSRRPARRRPLLVPVLASGLMLAVLVIGVFFTLMEIRDLRRASGMFDSPLLVLAVLPCTAWAAWAVFFYFLSRRQSVPGVAAAQSCTLLAGSILELLVAVPTHIAARQRGECCAGVGSFIGLSLGVSVLLFAFGPATFFLYLARWRRLRRRRGPDCAPAFIHPRTGHTFREHERH
jgi:hypothetical protein